MTDDPVAEPFSIAPPPERQLKRRRGRPNKPRAKPTLVEVKPEEFAGLTENSCCDACTPTHCVISGTFMPAHIEPAYINHFRQMMPAISVPDSTICGHPLKTPVNVFVKDPRVVDRYARAKKILEHMILDSRNKGITRGR
jgi:hypothetical protein